jgi:hypothetical protein
LLYAYGVSIAVDSSKCIYTFFYGHCRNSTKPILLKPKKSYFFRTSSKTRVLMAI